MSSFAPTRGALEAAIATQAKTASEPAADPASTGGAGAQSQQSESTTSFIAEFTSALESLETQLSVAETSASAAEERLASAPDLRGHPGVGVVERLVGRGRARLSSSDVVALADLVAKIQGM